MVLLNKTRKSKLKEKIKKRKHIIIDKNNFSKFNIIFNNYINIIY